MSYDIILKEDITKLKEYVETLPTVYEPLTRHKFLDGMYYREMFALKDTIIIGATHTKPCYNILLKGEIAVNVRGKTKILEAPLTFVTVSGVQKVGYCLTDVLWANVFRTDLTTVQEVEKELFKEEIYKENRWVEQ